MQWFDALVQGVLLGGMYAQYALGMALMFGVMKIVNITHGDLMVLLALTGISAATTWAIGPWAILVLLVVVGVRLVQLQGLDPGNYALAAAQERLAATPLHALRGTITDRDGTVLAYTTPARNVVTDPTLIPLGERSTVADQLAPLIGVPAATIVDQLASEGRYVVLARELPMSAATKVDQLGLTGIFTEASSTRLYPAGATGIDVIGRTYADGSGSSGIEATYQDVLAGKDGRLTYELDADGNANPSGLSRRESAVDGGTVTLTISQDLQYTVQSLLDAKVAESSARSGQVAVLDARSGQILALAASGAVDGVAAETGLTNPAVQQVFEPGSVNKLVTFAAALETGTIAPDTVLSVPYSLRFADITVRDAWWHATTNFTATGVFAKSSNVGTLQIAEQIGPDTFMKYAKLFGQGELTGVELPGESPGLLPERSEWSGSTFGNLPIGQGVAITVLQMASMYQAIANDGVRIPPRIVASVTGPTGIVTPTEQPAGVRVVSPDTAEELRLMMEAVTQDGGTGTVAAIPGYRVGGKSGTAQQPDPECGGCYSNSKYWATFTGMVPADDPQYVIAVMIDQAANGAHGGTLSTPLFKDIATYLLQRNHVPPSGSQTPEQTLQVP